MATIKNRQKSSAQWLRCEIIDFLPNANVALRYVDLGTRGILKLKNLHRMHIEHTKIAPACIEIGRFLDDDLSMADSEMEWNTHFWREIVPYDVPIVVGPDMGEKFTDFSLEKRQKCNFCMFLCAPLIILPEITEFYQNFTI